MFDRTKNTFNTLFPNKVVLIPLTIAIGLLLIVMFIGISLLRSSGTLPGVTSPTPTPVRSTIDSIPQGQKLSPLQKSAVGITPQEELEDAPTFESKTPLPDGTTRYTFGSEFVTRKNEVITKDGKAVFERILIPISSKSVGYARMSDFTKRYGQPQNKAIGSRFHGPFITTFIYANKGFAVIGNTRTDEAFEIHQFAPTTPQEYRRLYGDDIDENDTL